MNKYKKHFAFIASILFLFTFLVGYIVMQERVVRGGETFILETRPIDPRDLLRGEYVILSYKIENDQQLRKIVTDQNLRSGDTVYIKLRRDAQGIGQVFYGQTQRPPQLDDGWLIGKVSNRNVVFPEISQYFVPEGAGLPIERLGTNIRVEVSIKDGRALITRLLDENLQPIDPASYLDPR